MTLQQLCSDLFLYLVTFRRKVRKEIPVSLKQAKADLIALFDSQRAQAEADAELKRKYQKVFFALVVLADEVVLTSNWEHARQYEREILEQHYFRSSIGGAEFFAHLQKNAMNDPEAAEIFYLCLTLGFKGQYSTRPEQLREIKMQLYNQIRQPETRSKKMFPAAYHTIQGEQKLLPLLNFMRFLFISVALVIVYLITNQVLWRISISRIISIAEMLAR